MSDFLQALLDTHDEFQQGLVLWLGLSALSAILLYDGWLGVQWTGGQLFRPQRRRAVPWGGWTILGLLFTHLLVQSVTAGVLSGSDFFSQLYGPEFQTRLRVRDPMAQARFSLWIATAAFLPQLGAALAVLLVCGDARPYQYGWTRHRLGRNLLLGVLAWLVFMPWILTCNAVVTEWYQHWLGGPPEPHELERLAQGHPRSVEWVLLVLSAVVMAPVWEELLFRGVLLSWAQVRRRNADLLIVWSLLLVLLLRSGTIAAALRSGTSEDWELEAQPILFALLLTAGYEVMRRFHRSPTDGAIYATALLFANAHAQVWPSPVPLFFLGLVLAWLAVRTESLVAPMVLHGLFNAVACVTLIVGS